MEPLKDNVQIKATLADFRRRKRLIIIGRGRIFTEHLIGADKALYD